MKAKIFLNVTKRSMMDVTGSLRYYEEKRNKFEKVIEDVYKGNIIFSITEKGEDGKALMSNGRKQYLSSFMNKDTSKILFKSILEDRFIERFGKRGIKDYGGSDNKEGQLRSRITKVFPYIDKDSGRITHYIFRIEEGKGVRAKNGKGTVIDGDSDITVESWIPYVQSLKMATEILDYIRDEELKAMLEGKPLYTIMYGKNGKPSDGKDINEKVEEKKMVEKQLVREPNLSVNKDNFYNEQNLSNLSDKELKNLLASTENNDQAKELYKHAVKEAKKRMGKAL